MRKQSQNLTLFFMVLMFTFSLVSGVTAQVIEPQRSTTGPVPPASISEKTAMEMIPPVKGGTSKTISGVPGYAWRHGCGPTALGMVVGYYDGQGFGDLYVGDASTQTSDVNQGIASQGSGTRGSGTQKHYEDYSLPMDSSESVPLDDSSETYPTGCHTDDSIADYMHTSWSSDGNFYGWSWSSRIIPAYNSYVAQQNSSYNSSSTQYYMQNNTLTWSVLTTEIDNNRPMVFLVDTNEDGGTDHFVTVIGYNDGPPQQYACLDTWYPYDSVRWCGFEEMANGVSWGIWGGWSFSLQGSTSTPTPTSTATPTQTPTVTATPTPTSTEPLKVTGVNATKSDYPGLILVTWDSLGGGAYEVWRNTSNDLGSASLVRYTGNTQYYDTAITPGSRYYYWVRGQNQYGYGPFSDPDWGYAGVPPTVLGMTVSKGDSPSWIRVTWESLGGGAYEVWRNTSNDIGTATLMRTTGNTQFYDTTMTQGVRYYYWVRATNRFGYGAYCSPDWGYAGVPPAVLGLTATNAASPTWVLVEWDSLEGGSYEIWRNTADDIGSSSLMKTTGNTWFYDTTVTPGVRYYYWVRGINRFGNGVDSESAWGFAGTPPAVLDLDAGKASYADRIPISWGSMDGGAYELWRGTTDDIGSAALLKTTGNTSFTDLAIASGERYYYWVRALNRYGAGVYSNSDWGFAGAAPAVQGLNASDGTYTNKIIVDWESLGGGTYQVWRNTSDYSGTAELKKTTGDTAWTDWSVIPGEIYYYWVNGVNRFGTGDLSDSDPGNAGTP